MLQLLSFLLLVLSVVCLVLAIERQITRNVSQYVATVNQQTGQGLAQLFLFIDVRQIWPVLLGLSSVCALLTYALTSNAVITFMACCGTFLIPKAVIRRAIRRRYEKFNLQLPKALLSLSAMLKAGLNLTLALNRLEGVSPSPLSEEVGVLNRQLRLGVSFDQGFESLHQRIPLESVMITTSLFSVSVKTGGSLANLLGSHAKSLQHRQHQIAKTDALTTQARLQAWVMGFMPVVLFLAIQLVSPELAQCFYDTQTGQWVIGLIVILDLSGIWMIHRILRVNA